MEISYNDGHLLIERGERTSIIPIGAVATWSELLGMANAVDVVDAILHKDNVLNENPEAEVDPETGQSIWDEVMTLKSHLEKVREDAADLSQEAMDAQEEFNSARAISDYDGQRRSLKKLRECGASLSDREAKSTERVREELQLLTGSKCGDSDSILAKCQARARSIMGFPDPDDPPSPERAKSICCRAEGRCGGQSKVLPSEDREKLSRILGEGAEWLAWRRRLYAHQLSGRAIDPLDDHSPVLEGDVDETQDTRLARIASRY